MNTDRDSMILRCTGKHGDRYDYSDTIFGNKSTVLKVICSDHGEFCVTQGAHLHSSKPSGCPRCSGKVITTEDFITKALNVHGDTYDYHKTEYVKATSKVTITCREHGDFQQSPTDHIRVKAGRRPSGCRLCGFRKISEARKDPTPMFISKSIGIHGSKYDYSKVVYSGSRRDVEIVCPDHGSFHQRPSRHIQGSGCPKCSSKGYFCEGFFKSHPEYKDREAIRYIVKMSLGDESFYKVGITTTSVPTRFASENHEVETIDILNGTLYECFIDEQEILSKNAEFKYTPCNSLTAGNTECLSRVTFKI